MRYYLILISIHLFLLISILCQMLVHCSSALVCVAIVVFRRVIYLSKMIRVILFFFIIRILLVKRLIICHDQLVYLLSTFLLSIRLAISFHNSVS